MFKKFLIGLYIVAGAGFVFFVGVVVLMAAFGVFDKTYTKHDLIANFEHKEKEMLELKDYFNSIVPAGKVVEIEFDGDDELGIFHISTFDSTTQKQLHSSNWDVTIGSATSDSLIAILGWSQETLQVLKSKLDKANCISVTNSNPFNIGFQRSGMGMYYYNVFDKPMPDSLKSEYDDGCTYIRYTDKVVLEYGGGAVGPQCFPM